MNERFAPAKLIARVELAHEPDFRLGSVRVFPSVSQVLLEGRPHNLQPRVMQVLVALARAQGQVLSREDLTEACWAGRSVSDDAIERCIAQLRKLAARSGNAFTVETIPRIGYKLEISGAAPLPRFEDMESAEPVGTRAAPASLTPPVQRHRTFRWASAILGLLAFIVIGGVALWRLWPAAQEKPAAPAGSLAVLPFVNLSGDPSKDYFSDGFSEELIDRLSDDPDLRVVSRAAAISFRGKGQNLKAVAQALHARAIVEGSVREAGNQVRIAVQLIDPNSGYSLWSATYNRNLADILSVQDEVASTVAQALTHKLTRTEIIRRNKIDPTVYRLYLQARKEYDRVSRDGLKALALLKKVTAKQPDFANGFAALSTVAFTLAGADPVHDPYAIAAQSAAQRALALDPHNIIARSMREIFELTNWDWSAASSDIRALRAENQNKLQVLASLRSYYVELGFPEAAMAASRRLVSLYPSAIRDRIVIIQILSLEHRFPEAAIAALKVLAQQPDQPWALLGLCEAYAGTRRIPDARRTGEQLRRIDPDTSPGNLNDRCLLSIDIAGGDAAPAAKILDRWAAAFPDKFTEARLIGDYYVALKDFDKASAWYERAYERHEPQFFEAVLNAAGASYRASNARWRALREQPMFRAWQTEHDRIASALNAHPRGKAVETAF